MKFLKALLIGVLTCIVLLIAPLGGLAVAVITLAVVCISWFVDNVFGKKKNQ